MRVDAKGQYNYDEGAIARRRKLSAREQRRANVRFYSKHENHDHQCRICSRYLPCRYHPNAGYKCVGVKSDKRTYQANAGTSFFGRFREAWRQALEALKDTFSS